MLSNVRSIVLSTTIPWTRVPQLDQWIGGDQLSAWSSCGKLKPVNGLGNQMAGIGAEENDRYSQSGFCPKTRQGSVYCAVQTRTSVTFLLSRWAGSYFNDVVHDLPALSPEDPRVCSPMDDHEINFLRCYVLVQPVQVVVSVHCAWRNDSLVNQQGNSWRSEGPSRFRADIVERNLRGQNLQCFREAVCLCLLDEVSREDFPARILVAHSLKSRTVIHHYFCQSHRIYRHLNEQTSVGIWFHAERLKSSKVANAPEFQDMCAGLQTSDLKETIAVCSSSQRRVCDENIDERDRLMGVAIDDRTMDASSFLRLCDVTGRNKEKYGNAKEHTLGPCDWLYNLPLPNILMVWQRQWECVAQDVLRCGVQVQFEQLSEEGHSPAICDNEQSYSGKAPGSLFAGP